MMASFMPLPLFYLGKNILQAKWAPESARMLKKRENSLSLARNQTTNFVVQPMA
jgi:hypothetical protein